MRLNTDGTLDTTFDIGAGFNGLIWTLLLDHGKLYVGGAFSAYDGNACANICLLYTSDAADE